MYYFIILYYFIIKEFQNLHIDPYEIGKINSQKQGPNIRNKNGFIINTGGYYYYIY